VIGTVRREGDARAFAALAPGRAHPVMLDVTDFKAISAAVVEAERHGGPIDVLVNNGALF
jgi:NAD(P)-dependent dehydrogenase (short-subunit alcohol dehydrogenase family)